MQNVGSQKIGFAIFPLNSWMRCVYRYWENFKFSITRSLSRCLIAIQINHQTIKVVWLLFFLQFSSVIKCTCISCCNANLITLVIIISLYKTQVPISCFYLCSNYDCSVLKQLLCGKLKWKPYNLVLPSILWSSISLLEWSTMQLSVKNTFFPVIWLTALYPQEREGYPN